MSENDSKLGPDTRAAGFNWGSTTDRIRLLKERVRCWFLEPAGRLSGEHEGLALLMICLPYVEMVGTFSLGGSAREDSFVRGWQLIFGRQHDEPSIRRLYTDVRCGLLHFLMLKPGAYSTSNSPVLLHAGHELTVNPRLLYSAIDAHFSAMISEMEEGRCPRLVDGMLKAWDDLAHEATAASGGLLRIEPQQGGIGVEVEIPPAGEPPGPEEDPLDNRTGEPPRRRPPRPRALP